ncbi:hypothetical protein FHETE_1851 [Fusarium heterosporum]|uniref:VOC domain-containing protein n=1 Tax=Fusarium heterosporum TaxID=42747 RepID=A0A8H5TY89_FUSHE|nr:hypothetical protein FHETE_1851 [Fusarium heterosporum]
MQARTDQKYPEFTLQPNEPSDWATISFSINHLSINTESLTVNLEFYSSFLGLRKLFTLQVSKAYFTTYMGHAHGGRNGTGHQPSLEMNRERNNAQDMIELCYADVPINSTESSSQRAFTFGHIGVIVPNIEVMQQRLDAIPRVSVIKRRGQPLTDLEKNVIVGPSLSLPEESVAQLSQGQRETIVRGIDPTFEPLIFVTDPDGNFIEIQPQEG